ncbi:MAG TPA: glycosyltransferase [Gaiellaceae bacterium]|nr:glycosyltransferase [Gaiellaceae bacterium]
MTKRAIRVVYYTDAQGLGGAELCMGNLLAALSPRIEATVVGTNEGVVERLAGMRSGTAAIVLSPIKGVRDVAATLAHARTFRRLRPAIIQLNYNTCGASPWATVAALAIRGVRVIVVEHQPHAILTRRRRAIARLTSRFLDAHVAVGERAADEVARFVGIPRSSLRVIRNAVPQGTVVPERQIRSGPVVGSIGRLDWQKAYDVLIRALPELPGVTAVIVGEGEERLRLTQLARELGVSDRLELTGWHDDARRLLGSFDVFVLSSRFEGLPLVVLEAMLAGLPVVAADVGSVSEAVVDGSTGLLVPPGDPAALARALAELLADPARRREMGETGRRRALESFRVEDMGARYDALYDEVLS